MKALHTELFEKDSALKSVQEKLTAKDTELKSVQEKLIAKDTELKCVQEKLERREHRGTNPVIIPHWDPRSLVAVRGPFWPI